MPDKPENISIDCKTCMHMSEKKIILRCECEVLSELCEVAFVNDVGKF